MGKTIYIDDGDALNIDRVIVNMPNSKWCKVLYSCDLIDEYEDRLKADMIAMLENLDLEIDEHSYIYADGVSMKSDYVSCENMHNLVRILINNLKK